MKKNIVVNITGILKNQDEEMPKEEKPSVQPSINNELLSKKSIFVAKVKYPYSVQGYIFLTIIIL